MLRVAVKDVGPKHLAGTTVSGWLPHCPGEACRALKATSEWVDGAGMSTGRASVKWVGAGAYMAATGPQWWHH
jgi:hypothetical protein